MKHVYLFSVLIAGALCFTACSKDGAAGPKGDTGAAGAAGAAGPAGATGAKGDTGVANVIYSDWMDVSYKLVNDTASNGSVSSFYVANLSAPKLTKDVVASGMVKVYINVNTADDPAVSEVSEYGISMAFGVGIIQLISSGDASTVTISGQKIAQYRYVIVPGGVKAGKTINWNDYRTVKQYLHLNN